MHLGARMPHPHSAGLLCYTAIVNTLSTPNGALILNVHPVNTLPGNRSLRHFTHMSIMVVARIRITVIVFTSYDIFIIIPMNPLTWSQKVSANLKSPIFKRICQVKSRASKLSCFYF